MSVSLKVPALRRLALKQPLSVPFLDADVFQSNDAVVLVETEAQMPRTYPSDAEAFLSLSGKTLKDVKFRSLVKKEGKLMTLQEQTNQKVPRIRNKALGDPRAAQQNLDMKLVPVSPINVRKLRQPPKTLRWKLKQSIF